MHGRKAKRRLKGAVQRRGAAGSRAPHPCDSKECLHACNRGSDTLPCWICSFAQPHRSGLTRHSNRCALPKMIFVGSLAKSGRQASGAALSDMNTKQSSTASVWGRNQEPAGLARRPHRAFLSLSSPVLTRCLVLRHRLETLCMRLHRNGELSYASQVSCSSHITQPATNNATILTAQLLAAECVALLPRTALRAAEPMTLVRRQDIALAQLDFCIEAVALTSSGTQTLARPSVVMVSYFTDAWLLVAMLTRCLSRARQIRQHQLL